MNRLFWGKYVEQQAVNVDYKRYRRERLKSKLSC